MADIDILSLLDQMPPDADIYSYLSAVVDDLVRLSPAALLSRGHLNLAEFHDKQAYPDLGGPFYVAAYMCVYTPVMRCPRTHIGAPRT